MKNALKSATFVTAGALALAVSSMAQAQIKLIDLVPLAEKKVGLKQALIRVHHVQPSVIAYLLDPQNNLVPEPFLFGSSRLQQLSGVTQNNATQANATSIVINHRKIKVGGWYASNASMVMVPGGVGRILGIDPQKFIIAQQKEGNKADWNEEATQLRELVERLDQTLRPIDLSLKVIYVDKSAQSEGFFKSLPLASPVIESGQLPSAALQQLEQLVTTGKAQILEEQELQGHGSLFQVANYDSRFWQLNVAPYSSLGAMEKPIFHLESTAILTPNGAILSGGGATSTSYPLFSFCFQHEKAQSLKLRFRNHITYAIPNDSERELLLQSGESAYLTIPYLTYVADGSAQPTWNPYRTKDTNPHKDGRIIFFLTPNNVQKDPTA